MINIKNIKKIIRGAKHITVYVERRTMMITDNYFMLILPVKMDILNCLAEKLNKATQNEESVRKLYSECCCLEFKNGEHLVESEITKWTNSVEAFEKKISAEKEVVDTGLLEYIQQNKTGMKTSRILTRIIKTKNDYMRFNEDYIDMIDITKAELALCSNKAVRISLSNDVKMYLMSLAQTENINVNLKDI